MLSTVLELIVATCEEANLPVPETIVGNADSLFKSYYRHFLATGRKLLKSGYWPELVRSHTIFLTAGRDRYPLPADFHSYIPQTFWDRSMTWGLSGPQTPQQWGARLYGFPTVQGRRAFRVYGPDVNSRTGGGQFFVYPTPTAADQDEPVTFEYTSKSWIAPPMWTPIEAGVATGKYRFSAGNVYKNTGGSGTTGTVPPNMAYGVGRHGSVEFKHIGVPPAWAGLSTYAPGQYVLNSGRLYRCTKGGLAALAPGPAGEDTSHDVTDGNDTYTGTARWRFVRATEWSALGAYGPQTAFGYGDVVYTSGVYYRCVKSGTTSSDPAPNFTATTVTDGTVTQTFQEGPYEKPETDNDIPLFDPDLMMMGMKWRFLQSRREEFADIKREWEALIKSERSKHSNGLIFSLSNRQNCNISQRLVGEGNFGTGGRDYE